MKAVVTGVDVYRWYPSGTPGEGPVEEAQLGDTIDVSQDEFNRVEGALSKPGSAEAKGDDAPSGFPGTHDELDKLAEGVDGITVKAGEGNAKSTWNDGAVKTVADKQAALLAAGVEPPADTEE